MLNMHLFRLSFIATLWLLCHFTAKAAALKAKFTNLECSTSDKAFATFKHCYLKAIARDKVALYAHLQLHQLPVTTILVNAGLFQKGNGYRPFLYNNTVDFCAFKLRPSSLMFWKILYDASTVRSNLNHTCPYNHDLIMDGLVLNGGMFSLIPFPPNDYQLQFKWVVSNSSVIEVRHYLKIFD